ncbi:glycosyltransferase family 4 protein [Burkholderia sp. MSMB1589WGS]|uniref:glycosyltransferase family 4 protein n=1 Tax=Burkholderia sp. MSMB1589WGS TaxID=1636425 RepID=UPI0007BA107C|nr:glycosyltransferase family 4 protein [Burkholderia sp. MSMB1589WGS]
MRLLVVGSTYITAVSQEKFVAMKRHDPGLELKILTPRSLPHVFKRYTRELASGLSKDEVVDIRDYFCRSHMSYMLDPLHFARVLREFQPDRVHIEEDPHSASGFETVLLTRCICPSAKISFFLWDNLAREPRFPLNVIKRTLNRYALRSTELVICGNRDGERLLREKKGYAGRAAVLPQVGLDPAGYTGKSDRHMRRALNIPENVPLIGYVGRLIPEKGIMQLLEALHRLLEIPWRILIVGAGALETDIADRWKPVFEERLVMHNAVPHAEMPAYMRALDILVLPSYATRRWKEQFGLVLAQAMLAGAPCVGSTSGAIPDVIGPGGLVFQENNVDDLTTALKCLLTDEDARRSLGESAQAFALQRYTHAAVARAYLNQFDCMEGPTAGEFISAAG